MAPNEQYLSILRTFLSENGDADGITRMGIFGSTARGEQTPESDVDVLVEAPVLDLLSLIGIKHNLEVLFGAPVDVVRKTEYIPKQFKERIEKEIIYV